MAATGPAQAITAFGQLGHDLARPECVLATASGRLFVSDRRGGVTCLEPDGRQHRLGTSHLVPNGIALQRDGSFLVADLGEQGGVWRIDAQGAVQPWLMEFEGRALPRVNYVTTDEQERTWICVSATTTGDHYPVNDATGFILLHDKAGVRVVADGLRYTNEIRLHPDGGSVYVNETFGRRLSRLRIGPHGRLSDRATVAEFGPGDFPDGLALDVEGGIWVICVGSNRVYRVLPDGEKQLLIDDADPQCVDRLERAYNAGELTRPMLGCARGRTLANVTSLAFGGPDMRNAWMGSLAADSLATFRSPVAGLRPAHWNWA
jgi:sugar lactone lactonase YvrE